MGTEIDTETTRQLANSYTNALGSLGSALSTKGTNESADDVEEVKQLIGELKKLKDFFRKADVREALMAGKIRKVRLFQENVRPDFEMVKMMMKTRDFKDDSLLGGIADYLGEDGEPTGAEALSRGVGLSAM